MAKPFNLGRGLGSLIPNKPPITPNTDQTNYWGGVKDDKGNQSSGGVTQLPLSSIVTNPNQPREKFDNDALAELTSSIKTHGVLQPLVVSPRADGKYDLIVGERRYRASTAAGLKTIPVIVRPVQEQEKLEIALVENIQRQNLNPLEEAKGYMRLHDEFNLTQEDIAKKVGKSRSQVANTIRLLDLPATIQQALWEGKLTVGHAKVILSLETPAEQEKFFKLITAEGLPVRLAEAKAASLKNRPVSGVKTALPPQIRDWQERLQRQLGTRVKISQQQGRGKIEIEFYSIADLEAIINKLMNE